jgi:GT2 family glycosyltransferase
MNNPQLDLAVILVSYNTCAMLRACLRSVYAGLAALRAGIDAEVWVVDNASSDGSPEIVRAEYPETHLLALEQNLGFAGGNNAALRQLGFEASTGQQPELVLFLNPDTEVQGSALASMADALFSLEGAGVVGASLVYPDGRFQHSAFHFPTLWQIWFDFFPGPRACWSRRSTAATHGRCTRPGGPLPSIIRWERR